MDVLIVGSGGREHALAWKLRQSPRIETIYVAPGNGGTATMAQNVPIHAMDFQHLAEFAQKRAVGLTIVSSDDPLASGIVDFFKERGLPIWGPSRAAARVEWSKSFAKDLMKKGDIPTARFGTFTDYDEAVRYVREHGAPIVVKANGLAVGKGVYVCTTTAEAERALEELMVERKFQDAGNEVVVEEFLEGPEISTHAISDGTTYTLFPPTQDHKRAFDNDIGPNTGGMGVIGPLPFVKSHDIDSIESRIVAPTFEVLKQYGIAFSGLLYPGLMLTRGGPKVLEYNARFGDPEAQVYMRLLKTDVLDLFEACIGGTLARLSIEWYGGFAVNIVLASGGYPDQYKRGFPITGIEDAQRVESVVVFHAGTTFDGNGRLITDGGRVFGVSATGSSLAQALNRAYDAADRITFQGKHYRKDIGAKSLQ